jgi:hypothetical protein
MALTKATYSMISGAVANVLDYGADPTGVADSKVAIDLALNSGKGAVYFPNGTYKYIGQMTVPSNVNVFGAGMYATLIDFTFAGYAIVIQGIGSELSNFRMLCSTNGVLFQTPSLVVGYTLYNKLTRLSIVGPGRSATYVTRSTHGVFLESMGGPGGASATFFNTVRDCQITQFDHGITFDAPVGGASVGGNANHAFNNQIEEYWNAYNIRSIENEIRGGFLHSASGSGSDVTTGYRFENGAFNNAITPATGEPGLLARCFFAEAGTYNNNIDDGAYNYNTPSLDLGINNFRRNYPNTLSTGDLTENRYYTVPISEAIPTNSSAVYTLNYSSSAPALNAASCGTINIYIVRGIGAVTVTFFGKNIASVGVAPINFTGLFVNGSNVAHLVFYAGNNGTGTSAGNLNITLLGTGMGVSEFLGGVLTNAGTSNPTTDPA